MAKSIEQGYAPVSSRKGTDPIQEGSTLISNHFPKSPPLNIITLRVRISAYESGGIKDIQSIADGFLLFEPSKCFSWFLVFHGHFQTSPEASLLGFIWLQLLQFFCLLLFTSLHTTNPWFLAVYCTPPFDMGTPLYLPSVPWSWKTKMLEGRKTQRDEH